MGNTIADFNLGLNDQAVALLAILSKMEPLFAPHDGTYEYKYEYKTYAWYNGRENGVSLRINHPETRKFLYICFAEHRSTDSLVIYHWTSDNRLQPPLASDLSNDVYKNGILIANLRFDMAVSRIIDIIKLFLVEQDNLKTVDSIIKE